MFNFRPVLIALLGLLFFVPVLAPHVPQNNLPHLTGLVTAVPTLTATPKITSLALTAAQPSDADLIRLVSLEQIKINPSATEKLTRQDIDITGDEQVDILLGGTTFHGMMSFLAVFSRPTDNAPWEIIFYSDETGRYWADIRVSIEDNRVIADFLTANGGSGIIDIIWRQQWIECQSDTCTILWNNPMLHTWQHTNSIADSISRGYNVSEVEHLDSDTIRVTAQEFALANVPYQQTDKSNDYHLIDIDKTHWLVGPNVEKIYQLNNGRYKLVKERQLSSTFDVVRRHSQQTYLTASFLSNILAQESDSYHEFKESRARFWGLPSPDESSDPIWGSWHQELESAASDGFISDYFFTTEKTSWVAGVISAIDRPLCLLTVQRYSAKSFKLIDRIELPCIANLTRLDHADVNADGQDELLLLTVPPDDSEVDTQRLYVFSIGKEVTEIAQFDGSINGSDMVGVRWEQNEATFRIFTGIPLIDLHCSSRTWACVTEKRSFEIHEWQADAETFQLISGE